MSVVFSTIALALTTTVGSCASTIDPVTPPQLPAAEAQPKAVSLAAVASSPAEYAGQEILLRGKLVNAGKNYFTDRRIVLTDDKGNTLEVLPWLPISRPSPSGQTKAGTTLAEFLDRNVELVGSMTPRTEPTRTKEFIFKVKSARILDA